MNKQKQRITIDKKNYFYEIVGIFTIIIGLVIIGGLGKIGLSLKIIFMIIFGDLATTIIIMIMIMAINCMVKKNKINFRSISVYGTILIILGTLSLLHLSIYESLSLNQNNILKGSYKLYKIYYSSYSDNYIFGGGMIGAIILQISIFLFGKVASIILNISLILSGILIISNSSFIHLISIINTFKKKLIFLFKRIFSIISKIDLKPDRPKREVVASVNILSDIKPSINQKIEQGIAIDNYNMLKDYIINNNIALHIDGYYIGYSSTTYKMHKINETEFDFSKIFNSYILIKDNNYVYLDIKNQFRELLTLKKCLLMIQGDINLLPVGINNLGDLLCINLKRNNYYIISGDYNSGIRSYIMALTASIIIKYKDKFNLNIIDTKGDLRMLNISSEIIKYYIGLNQSEDILDDIALDIDKREEILTYLKVDSYLDIRDEEIGELIPKFIFINTNLSKVSDSLFSKLDYIIKRGGKCGIFVLVIGRMKDDLGNLNFSLANKICLHTKSLELSLRMINSNLLFHLDDKGDFLYSVGNKIYHGQLPFLSKYDFNNIIKKVIF